MDFPEREKFLGCFNNFTHNLEVFWWQKNDVMWPIPTAGKKAIYLATE